MKNAPDDEAAALEMPLPSRVKFGTSSSSRPSIIASYLGLTALMLDGIASSHRSFFDGFHLADRKRPPFNPGRLKRGQGDKYGGDAIRALNAERGVGCAFNKRRRATKKGGGA